MANFDSSRVGEQNDLQAGLDLAAIIRDRETSRFLPLVVIISIAMCGQPAARTAFGQRHAGISPRSGEPKLLLVGDGVEPAPIIYRPGGHAQEKKAAGQLAKYLSEISGVEFAARVASDPPPARALLIGEFETSLPKGLSREGFIIRTEGQRLYLCGGSPRATLYAVFCLLEEQLGCRWWSFNEEHVPSSRTIAVAAQNTHIEPAFRVHDLFNREGQSAANSFVFKRRGASGTKYTSVHNLCPMLKPHAAEHPDFLPMNKDGERKFNNVHMNYTASGMPEIVADALGKEVNRRKGNIEDFFYFAGMGDWYGGMDLSPESKQVYEQERWVDPDGRKKAGYSATLLRMVNRAAELLEKEHPGVVVATHAYMSLEAPPSLTRPRANVVIEIPRLRHDTVLSIEESEKNQSFRRNVDRWCELAPGRVYIWEYGVNFNNFIKPFPCLRSIAANLKHYHRIGVAGVRIQGNYVSQGGDLVVLKNYVWGKLLWDPSRNVDDLIEEFCQGYYGPASDEMIAYVNLLEGSVRGATTISADEFEKDFGKWMRPEIIQQAETLFDRALSKTNGDDSDPYFRRLKEAQASLEAFHLWNSGEFIEQGENLVRKDLRVDTLPRARDLIKYCRRASPREWGDGRAYRMSFLAMQGGPLPTLRSGPITVKVAPLQGGQIRSVMLGDVIAIDQSRDLPNPGPRLYELTARAGNHVEMQAELGVAHWGSSTKQMAFRSVEVAKDGTILATGSIQLAAKVRQDTNQPSVQTIFHCGDRPTDIVIEYLDEQKRWVKAAVDADKTKVELSRAAELRVTRLDRKLVIVDRYRSPNSPSAVVEYLPQAKNRVAQVVVTVNLGTLKVNADGPTSYLERELKVTPFE